jgi:hypothetical protein
MKLRGKSAMPSWPSEITSNTLAITRRLTDGPPVVPPVQRKPLWLYPNLLSLDAPLVAVAWLYIFSKTWRVDYHPWEAYVTLGLTVWGVYVVDRLLDASLSGATGGRLQARHAFHRRHRTLFIAGCGIAFFTAAVLVVAYMSLSIYAYLLLGLVIVAGFFGLSMLSSQEAAEVPHTKNILAGMGFAFGTAMMAHVYLPELGVYKMLGSREFVCFAFLCILNISAIDLWEHAAGSIDLEMSATAELMLTIPLTLLGIVCLYYAVMDHQMATRPFFYAVLTGAALLQILNRIRGRFSMDALRVLADVALLLPVLVYLAAMHDAG